MIATPCMHGVSLEIMHRRGKYKLIALLYAWLSTARLLQLHFSEASRLLCYFVGGQLTERWMDHNRKVTETERVWHGGFDPLRFERLTRLIAKPGQLTIYLRSHGSLFFKFSHLNVPRSTKRTGRKERKSFLTRALILNWSRDSCYRVELNAEPWSSRERNERERERP